MPMPEAMETHGRSASLKKQQGTVRAAFEAFGECDEECAKVYGGGLDQLSEETLCHEDVVRRFATFLVEDWRAAGTGEHIGGATVLQYLSVLMNIIVNKYRSSDDAKTIVNVRSQAARVTNNRDFLPPPPLPSLFWDPGQGPFGSLKIRCVPKGWILGPPPERAPL